MNSRRAGAVLAGGASRRFGSPKAELRVDGVSLGARLLRTMGFLGLNPLIYNAPVGVADQPQGVITLPDRRAGRGPLEGLATVLAHVRGEALVAPCDLPGLDYEALQRMCDAWRPGMLGLVARGPDGWHPLWGIYSHALLPEIEARLADGKLALRDLAEDLGLAAFEAEERWLINVNTPADWEAWRRRNQRGA